MATPKIKLYRLDQNYSPDSDSDLRTASSDEAYPIVEKALDIGTYETLVGVTYRDLVAGRELVGEHEQVFSMYSEDDGETIDHRKTAFMRCDGWRKGPEALKVYIKLASLDDYLETAISEGYFRVNYSTEDAMYDSDGNETDDASQASSKVRHDLIQVEFGELLYGDGQYMESTDQVEEVRVVYHLWTDDLVGSGNYSDGYYLERGNIYDGTRSGRIGTVSGTTYGATVDSDGAPVKAEGNLGYKIRTYPLRVKVASLAMGTDGNGDSIMPSTTISGFVPDVEIKTGNILLEGCESWILTLTDERRPRVFERRTVTVDDETTSYFRELDQNEQYAITLIPIGDGTINVSIQLSSDYYNTAYGVYVYPEELFIRYNTEEDILEDLLVPDYLQWDGTAKTNDTGLLTASSSNIKTITKMVYRMALLEGSYIEGHDLLLTDSGDTKTIELGDIGTTDIDIYCNGELCYSSDGGGILDRDLLSSVNLMGGQLILGGASNLPTTGILISYPETHDISMGAVNGENPWCIGYRICAWEKTKTAKEFVSSFRNWVADHLNNNPDIFQGIQNYEGSSQNPTGISYINTDYSILYRDGAVQFTNSITQADASDVRNWPPTGSGLTYYSSYSDLKLYLNQIYAKFAYYDGIMDVTNGLLREIQVSGGNSRYILLNDPTYSDFLNDKRWIMRNDTYMPVTFFYNNSYLPETNYVDQETAELWTPLAITAGDYLRINLSDYRSLALQVSLSGTGSATLAWSPSYEGETTLDSTKTAYGNDVYWDLTASGAMLQGGDGTVLPYTGTFDPTLSVADNIEARSKLVYETGDLAPYDIVLETGEDYLMVYARKREE